MFHYPAAIRNVSVCLQSALHLLSLLHLFSPVYLSILRSLQEAERLIEAYLTQRMDEGSRRTYLWKVRDILIKPLKMAERLRLRDLELLIHLRIGQAAFYNATDFRVFFEATDALEQLSMAATLAKEIGNQEAITVTEAALQTAVRAFALKESPTQVELFYDEHGGLQARSTVILPLKKN